MEHFWCLDWEEMGYIHQPTTRFTTSNDNIWEEQEDKDESDRIIPNIEDMVNAKGNQLNQQLD